MRPYNILIAGAVLLVSCTQSPDQELESVQADFQERFSATASEYFTDPAVQGDKPLEEAMEFLYAYMPQADIADHPQSYFAENLKIALRSRTELPWNVPDREFRHFVLPLRANNENLDDFRTELYEELKEKVKGLSMHDAVLSINHWCHEKMVYTPTDGRTISPLAAIKTAYGRCGEESTFVVAALRTVGIPARQVYTPRWAHTDDNHAWVEAWVNGQWHFFGGCEPEPVLDLGWFNAPASRGMLMHTKVFGKYNGPEEVMTRTPRYTEINVIGNYAPTANVQVSVTDRDGNPASGAKVEFKLYNYAEFYSVATKTADDDGKTFLTAGKGDMLVWASKDGKFGYGKVSFGQDESVRIVLDKDNSCADDIELNVNPPVESPNIPEVSPEQRAENDRLMAREDSLRTAYTATFLTAEQAGEELGDIDHKESLVRALVQSRGNHETILGFIRSLAPERLDDGAALLRYISRKDLQDVSMEVLQDHLLHSTLFSLEKNPRYLQTLFYPYVQNPRVSNEMAVPYKEYLSKAIGDSLRESLNPAGLINWVRDNVRVDPVCNLGGAPISPVGVWKHRLADKASRNIFFVAMARTLGYPARIDDVTGKVQIYADGEFMDVDFESSVQTASPKGRLVMTYESNGIIDDPKYYSHFSISRLTSDGTLRLLSYDEGDTDMGSGATWSNTFKRGTSLDAGTYLLVTGMRLASGGVLSSVKFFSVEDGGTTVIPLTMRENSDEIAVIGNFDSESRYHPAGEDGLKSILATTGRGYFAVGLLGVNQEPTNHALRDIAALGKDFEDWGRTFVLLFPSQEELDKFKAEDFPGLPSTVRYGVDADGSIRRQLAECMKIPSNSALPYIIIGDTFNRVVFATHGYTIGLGGQLLKTAKRL